MYDYNTSSLLHRLSAAYTFNNSVFNWYTSINATTVKQTFDITLLAQNSSTEGNEWTGGWVNRLSYRSFFGGADVLYFLGEKYYYPSGTGELTYKIFNSISLQNLYLGYYIKATKFKGFDVFANVRNIYQNQKEHITDSRKYYGLGFKLSL